MARTYRDVAIEEMLATVEEAMSHVIEWWETCRRQRKMRSSSFTPNFYRINCRPKLGVKLLVSNTLSRKRRSDCDYLPPMKKLSSTILPFRIV